MISAWRLRVFAAYLVVSIGQAVRTHDDVVLEPPPRHPLPLPIMSVKRQCTQKKLCLITANRALEQDDTLQKFFDACMEASNNQTDYVAFALQDHPNLKLPESLDKVRGLQDGSKFTFVDTQSLSTSAPGIGHLCSSRLMGGAPVGGGSGALVGASLAYFWTRRGTFSPPVRFGIALLAVPLFIFVGYYANVALDVRCGGVSLALFVQDGSVVPPDLVWGSVAADVTSTTMKGTVAVRYTINGRPLILASTHATEGVRAKEPGTKCPADVDAGAEPDKGIEREQMRVQVFKDGLGKIKELAGNGTDKAAVVWGGDFNQRSVDPQTGCPIFLEGVKKDQSSLADELLAKVTKGRDIIGQDESGNLATYSALQEDLVEASAQMRCPTYKKDEPEDGEEDGKLFWCKDSPEAAPMFYKSSRPPSWTDRIFHSGESWLRCSWAWRIPNRKDHDAVLVTCDVDSPGCSEVSS